MIENISSWTYTQDTTLHSASFIHAFHIRNFTIPGSWSTGCRWQLLPSLLYIPPPIPKDLPRIQAVLNREKWIFWSERISTSNPFFFASVFSRRGDLWGTHIECITRETISPWRVTRVLSDKLANRNSGGGATTLKTSLIPLFSTPWRRREFIENCLGHDIFERDIKDIRRVIWEWMDGSWMETLSKGDFCFEFGRGGGKFWGKFWSSFVRFFSEEIIYFFQGERMKNVIETKGVGDGNLLRNEGAKKKDEFQASRF